MKRRLFLLALLVCSMLPAFSRTTMRDMISNMPDSLLPLLTHVNRVDCIDFREAGMQARVTNRMGGTTELISLTDVYALWQYTEASVYEMRLLPVNDSTSVLCVVHTVQTPMPDSSVSFFDESWAPLPADDFISLPSDTAEWSRMEVSLSAEADICRATLHKETYLTNEDETASVVSSSIPYLYNWSEARFFSSDSE